MLYGTLYLSVVLEHCSGKQCICGYEKYLIISQETNLKYRWHGKPQIHIGRVGAPRKYVKEDRKLSTRESGMESIIFTFGRYAEVWQNMAGGIHEIKFKARGMPI